MQKFMLPNVKGFTLIEMLAVVLVIGVLVAFAIPSYQSYILQSNRVDVQTAMTEISQKVQTYQSVNRGYQGLDINNPNIFGSAKYPKSKPLYDLELVLTDSNGDGRADSWVLNASPIATERQKDDGQIRLNDQGWRCWMKGAASCTLSATSSWKDN